MFKKKEELSREKKIEVVSKNSSGLGFRKKIEGPEPKIAPKRMPLKEDVNTSRSSRKEQVSGEKNFKKETHEKSVYEEEETLEEQGYGLLLRDMKRCIKGEHASEDQSVWRDDRVVPKYLNLERVPGMDDRDSVGSKIEALRVYLEQEIGDDFYQVYNLMKEKDDDYASAKVVMGQAKVKFIPLIVQLMVCEDSYY